MRLRIADFNSAANLIGDVYSGLWTELEQILSEMPLHLKSSDQRGIEGSAIFDAVGTNEYIAGRLKSLGWVKAPIPVRYRFLGQDIDFFKDGIALEAQFSNYPFLLNNALRVELLHRSQDKIVDSAVCMAILLTKCHLFPASNSTLYYEQARDQLSALAEQHVFRIPIRLVGLACDHGLVEAVWSTYTKPRYSRKATERRRIKCVLEAGNSPRSRSRIRLLMG